MPVATTHKTRVIILLVVVFNEPKKLMSPDPYEGYSHFERYSGLLMVKRSFKSSVEGKKSLLSRSFCISSLKST